MSKWDWLHAGLEIATLVNAKKARQSLEEMNTATEIDAAHRFLNEALKNYIYDISHDIELAEEQISKSPQQVYIVSKLIHLRLENSGLSPKDLSDIQDKKFFSQTQKKIMEVIGKSKERLTPEEVGISEKTIKFIHEMPLLQPAIEAKAAQESLFKSEEKWEEFSARNGKNQTFLVVGIPGLLFSCLLLSMSILAGNNSTLLVIGIVMLAGSIAAIAKAKDSDPKYTKLKLKREALKEKLLPNDEWEQIVLVFKDLSSEQFKKIYDERISFLKSVLGDDFQKYLNSDE